VHPTRILLGVRDQERQSAGNHALQILGLGDWDVKFSDIRNLLRLIAVPIDHLRLILFY
jgi:hypothetical protein